MPAPALNDTRQEEESLFSRDIDGRLVRLDAVTASDLDREVTLSVDGRSVTVKKAVPATDAQGVFLRDEKGALIPRATTIYDAASIVFGPGADGTATGTTLFKMMGGKPLIDTPYGNPIPILCHREHMNPVAVCRICVVEISKVKRGKRQTERKLLPACQHRVEDTMEVQTVESPDAGARERIRNAVCMLTELLMADHPSPCAKEQQSNNCELESLARRFEVGKPRFPQANPKGRDKSSLVIAVDHGACILCDRCVRGCSDIRNNQVISRMGKGYAARIAFDLNAPMGNSSCVACGECSVSCPTGALTLREAVEGEPWKGVVPAPDPVSPRELYEHPIEEIRDAFEGVAREFLRWNAHAIVRRRFRKGDLICREGDFGATAFFIESGSVDVFIESASRKRKDDSSSGLFGFVRRLLPGGGASNGEQRQRRFIPSDSPVLLPLDRPIATMRGGELFGEMSCMSNYPRSATVVAAEDCTVLEMLRNVLYIMQRSRSYRAVLERKYRKRTIENHLQSVPLFSSLRANPADFELFVNELRPLARLIRCEPGQVIFRQGDTADDGFYMVRTGFVKVTQRGRGGDRVLSYIGPGGYFGEIALMGLVPGIQEATEAKLRTATCTALDHVDLVRIKLDDFREILDRLPEPARVKFIEEAFRRLKEDRDLLAPSRGLPLNEFLTQGLFEANSLLVLDLEKCTRCDECTKACSDAHGGITRLVREGLRFDKYLVASACRSCLDPYCMAGCPVGSIRRRESMEIVIEDWCIGCGKCSDNCPYGNINMHPFPTGELGADPEYPDRRIPIVQQKATTCDLCRNLGANAQPSCVYACPHDAAHRMTGQSLYELIGRSAMKA